MIKQVDEHRKCQLGKDASRVETYVARVLKLFHQLDRPVLLGSVSLAAGLSVEKSSVIVEILCDNGLARLASVEEKTACSFHVDACAYVLTGPAQASIAHGDVR